ncbi:serine threonine kinase [Micractinium conductrix]|uniref:Serine threonine kinase n=1 Tax=Micractinium conductrix TaxID=554055 RepID=A0A2P6VM43_9CHLO|nr:serine threonine kinase [Micractinium conductrix]|eukprot:PSC75153.1 serine threonine kinase [Micractinium conductrix]
MNWTRERRRRALWILKEFNLGELEAGKERAAQRVGAEDDDSPFGEHLDSAAGRMAFKGTERMAHGTSVELAPCREDMRDELFIHTKDNNSTKLRCLGMSQADKYIVYELAERLSIAAHLKALVKQPLGGSVVRLATWYRGLTRALLALNEGGIAHMGVTPENAACAEDGTDGVVLLEFGGGLLHNVQSAYNVRDIKVTPRYAAVETLFGHVLPTSDVAPAARVGAVMLWASPMVDALGISNTNLAEAAIQIFTEGTPVGNWYTKRLGIPDSFVKVGMVLAKVTLAHAEMMPPLDYFDALSELVFKMACQRTVLQRNVTSLGGLLKLLELQLQLDVHLACRRYEGQPGMRPLLRPEVLAKVEEDYRGTWVAVEGLKSVLREMPNHDLTLLDEVEPVMYMATKLPKLDVQRLPDPSNAADMAECFGQVPDADVFTKADLQARRQMEGEGYAGWSAGCDEGDMPHISGDGGMFQHAGWGQPGMHKRFNALLPPPGAPPDAARQQRPRQQQQAQQQAQAQPQAQQRQKLWLFGTERGGHLLRKGPRVARSAKQSQTLRGVQSMAEVPTDGSLPTMRQVDTGAGVFRDLSKKSMYLGTPAKVKSGLPQLWVRLPGAKSELKKLGNALNQALLLNPDMEGVGLQLARYAGFAAGAAALEGAMCYVGLPVLDAAVELPGMLEKVCGGRNAGRGRGGVAGACGGNPLLANVPAAVQG